MYSFKLFLNSEKEIYNFGKLFSNIIDNGFVLFLNGDLGVGKTTFSRGLIQGILNVDYTIKSPTFSIIELYIKNDVFIYHIDLYRLKSFSELVNIGFNDYFKKKYIFIFEWADKFVINLPEPNLIIYMYFFCIKRKFFLKSNYIDLKSLLV